MSSWEKEKVNGWRDGAGLAELGGGDANAKKVGGRKRR